MLGPGDFTGGWVIARRIDDRLAGQARFAGTAVLTPAPGGLAYAETGMLRTAAGAFEARRAYLWQFDAAGVAVLFVDGRPFHRFVPDGRAEGSDHPCGADLYRVTYDFTRWPDWSAVWTVTGPRKDYTMESRFVRTNRDGACAGSVPFSGAENGYDNLGSNG